MALNTRKPPQLAAVPKAEPDDEAFDRVMRKAPDYRPDPVKPATPAPAPEPEKPKVRARKVGNKVQITHTMSEDTLVALDALAKRLDIPRAATINLAIRQLLERSA